MAIPSERGRTPGAQEAVVAHGLTPPSASEFRALRDLIYERSGITLADSKTQLVASRLARRLRARGLTNYGAYFDLVVRNDPDGAELREMLNAITTNKTDFFRERHHFDFLTQNFLPRFIERARKTGERRLRVWSAGCSTGEEPYTLAMVILSAFPQSGFSLDLLATDLDTQVLERARGGIYPEESIEPVPTELQRRYFRRGTGANASKVRVNDAIREMITFRQLNFVEQPWPVQGPFDLIFCRNVMIYFNANTQRTIVESFAQRLRPDGYLFIGHSETLNGLNELYEPLRGTIYRRRGAGEGARASLAPTPPPSEAGPTPARPALAARSLPGPTPQRARATHLAAETGLKVVSVIIGGVRASREPAQLRTLLGSCVCACLYDPVAKIGGINHFMLPDCLDDSASPTRYGVNAMEMLINEMLKLGADRRRFQAKAFGAAHVMAGAGLSPDVPRKNAKFIKDFLETEGIPLVSSRLGGSAPVEIMFATETGKAMVRALGDNVARDLALEEGRFDLEVKKTLKRVPDGSVELF
jgi:chemotaxis protein methyltransferase CheR